MSYGDYLRSPAYRARRAEIIAGVFNRCEQCSDSGPLQVHHRHYETIGAEATDDLTALCETCHALTHNNVITFLEPLVVSDVFGNPLAEAEPHSSRYDAYVAEVESRVFVRWLREPGWRRIIALLMHVWVAVLAATIITAPVWVAGLALLLNG